MPATLRAVPVEHGFTPNGDELDACADVLDGLWWTLAALRDLDTGDTVAAWMIEDEQAVLAAACRIVRRHMLVTLYPASYEHHYRVEPEPPAEPAPDAPEWIDYGYGPEDGSRPSIIGFDALADATAKAEAWLAGYKAWAPDETRCKVPIFRRPVDGAWELIGHVVAVRDPQLGVVTTSVWL